MPEAMSPEDIENARFTRAQDGYDRDEVEVFLKSVAAEMRALRREIPSVSDRPYYDLGGEVADLLQHAHDSALHIKKKAEEEAALVLQEAQRASKRAREEAEQATKRAEKEATVVREEAYAAAERYKEQAEKAHRLADAERSIAAQEAHREGKRLRDEAKRKAQELVSRAKADAAERTADSERRLRRLQEADVAMRRRAALLQAKLDELSGKLREAQTESPAPDEPQTIYLEGAPEATVNGSGFGETEASRRSRPLED
jgi:DivIVA domain-containing protein